MKSENPDRKKAKPFAIIFGILLVTLVISLPSYLAAPREGQESQAARLPMTIAGWQGQDMSVEERAYEILETRNLVLREYTKGNDKVYLYIIYARDNRKVSHPPEVCFEGSGVTIVQKAKIPLVLATGQTITANRLVVDEKGAVNEVVYWYKAGAFYSDNYLRQQLAIALARLRFKQTSGALIRISAEVSPDSPGHALEVIKTFARDASALFPEIIP